VAGAVLARRARWLYHPAMVVWVDVVAERLARRYHRRWHVQHGRHAARMRLRELIDPAGGYLLVRWRPARECSVHPGSSSASWCSKACSPCVSR
jgi:hypothetical protein